MAFKVTEVLGPQNGWQTNERLKMGFYEIFQKKPSNLLNHVEESNLKTG